MEIWTAAVLSEDGTYFGTSVANTESELEKLVLDNYDAEGEYVETFEEFSWTTFEGFYNFDIRVEQHSVA
jgi:hypothetical protein